LSFGDYVSFNSCFGTGYWHFDFIVEERKMIINKIKAALLMLICSIVLSGTVGCYGIKYNLSSIPLPDDYRIISSGRGLFVVTEEGSLYSLNSKGKWDELSLDMKDAKDIKSTYYSDTIMVLRNDGTVYMVQPFIDNPEILEIPFSVPIASIEMGEDSYAAITEEGSLYLWGDNWYGALGNGTDKPIEEPYYVESLSNVSKVISKAGSTMVLTDEGTIFVCGRSGMVANDNPNEVASSTKFIQIEDLPLVADIGILGVRNFFALDNNGNLYAWGGRWGWHAPEIQKTNSTFVSIDSGDETLVLMDDAGSVFFIGPFYFGGYEEWYRDPTSIAGVRNADEIFASSLTFYARKGDKIIIIDPAEQKNIMNYK
jgi:hypothetical protein